MNNKDLNWLTSEVITEEVKVKDNKLSDKAKRAMSIVGTSEGRYSDDYYITPISAVEALLNVEKFEGNILEPCCGNGAISRVLEEYGYSTTSWDLVDRGFGTGGIDFLTTNTTFDNIITNPPYNIATEIVQHSLKYSTKKVCMLLKLAFLEGAKRQKLFLNSPLARVHVFSKRLSMYRQGEKGDKGSGMIAYAWYVWDFSHNGPATLHWL